jgi:TRAP-type uncharacterized transport system substrate-binding protein
MSVPVRRSVQPEAVGSRWLGLLVLGLVAAGCRQQPAQPQPRPILRVASAFAPFSTRLTEEYKRTLPQLDIQQDTAGSSAQVLSRMQAGTLDLGVVLADDAYRAYFG